MIKTKIREWIEAGARIVLALYPSTRTVNVVRSLTDRETLNADDVFDAGDIIPGFSCRVAEF